MSKKVVKIVDANQKKQSHFSLLNEISDEYIRYDKDLDLEKGASKDSPRGSVDSDVVALNDRKESGDFWRIYFKEQHVTSGGRSESDQKRKRRANGKNKDTMGVADWEGWWLRSSAWRRTEWILVTVTFLFAIAQLVSAIYLFVELFV